MKPAPFTYHRAHDIPHAIRLLTELGSDAKVLAGGQSLAAMMNFRLARPSALVDITRVEHLNYIRASGSELHVGGLTTHRSIELASAAQIPAGFAVLPRSAHLVGHYPIRVRGTMGGSIAHADPAAEWCLLAIVMDARIVIDGGSGPREVPATSFFRGFLTTALRPDEIVTEVLFPTPTRHAVLKEFARRRGDFAIVAAATALQIVDGKCTAVGIGLGGVDSKPIRVAAAEQVLVGEAPTPAAFREVADVAACEVEPSGDIHGTAAYRKHLTAVLVYDALVEATSGA